MDISSAKWLTDLGVDDYSSLHECDMNYIGDFTTSSMAATLIGTGHNFLQRSSFSSESNSSYPNFNPENATTFSGNSSINETNSQTCSLEKPTKLIKTNSWNSSTVTHELGSPKSSSHTSHFLSFENSNSTPNNNNTHQFYGNLDCFIKPKDEVVSLPPLISSQPGYDNINYAAKSSQMNNNKRPYSMTRTPSHAQDHILAERKRREKLSQRFIALSAIVPGLKKMDKASVLADTIKYVKTLQERVKVLEEQTKKRTVESVVFVKKSQLSNDDDSSSCDENFDQCFDKALPEIEAKVSDKDVLIRIHCEKQKGFLVKILNEIEKLQLSIVNSSALPFGNSTLDITVIARKDDEFKMTVKDLVKNLRLAFLEFM